MVLVIWLSVGIVGFFLQRAAWGLEFGCKPITPATLLGPAVFMWLPPATLIAGFCWTLCYLFQDDGKSFGRPIKKFFRRPLIDFCKLFMR